MANYKIYGYAPKNAPPGYFSGFVGAASKMTAQVKAESAFRKPYLKVIATEIALPGFKLVKADEKDDGGEHDAENG